MKKIYALTFLVATFLLWSFNSIQAQNLLHFWDFNEITSSDPGAPTSTIGGASITYAGVMDPVNSGTTINARNGAEAGQGLRVRNPAEHLYIYIPTIGHKDIRLSYASERTTQGMLRQILEYTLDGNIYITTDLANNIVEIQDREYRLFSFDFTNVAGVNNNPHFAVRIRFEGQTVAENGNNRFDNIAVDGVALETVPVRMVIGSGDRKVEGAEVTIGSLSFLSDATGVVIMDLSEGRYDFQVKAPFFEPYSGSFSVEDATSDLHVELTPLPTYNLELVLISNGVPVSYGKAFLNGVEKISDAAGKITFAGLYEGNYETMINGHGFFAQELTFSLGSDTSITVDLSSEQGLIHYWNFNANNVIEDQVVPNYTIGGASLSYGGQWNNVNNGSTLNLRNNDEAGSALRIWNPADIFTMKLPTTGFLDVKLSYATMRTSGNGMLRQIVEYSLDGVNFTDVGLSNNEIEVTEDFKLVVVDFASIAGANDNPNFRVRIRFNGNTTGDSGNNRFDNISLEGRSVITAVDSYLKGKALQVFPNPASNSDIIRFNRPVNARIYNAMGEFVSSIENSSELRGTDLASGIYLITTDSGDAIRLLIK